MNIRKANVYDAIDIARVHIDAWRSTYRNILSEDFLEELSFDKRKKIWLNKLENSHGIYVAENIDGKVVGFIDSGAQRRDDYEYQGEIYAVYILDEYQNHRVGSELMYRAVKNMIEKEYSNLIIWMLDGGPANYFYKKIGGDLRHSRIDIIGGKKYKLNGYVWYDINELHDILEERVKDDKIH